MKRFWGFVIKEFYHILRDYRTMLILFGMPLIQILIFGFVVSTEIIDARIAILDQSKDVMTKKLISKIASSGYFLIEHELKNTNEIEGVFKQGNIKLVIIFDTQFSEKITREGKASVQIIADASYPNTSSLLTNYTMGIIRDFSKDLPGHRELPVQISSEVQMYYNPGLKGVFMFVPGTMAMILMLISAMMTSISIVKEKEMGTMETLLVSPLRPIQIILGKVTPYVLLSFINAVTIITLGYFIFGLPVTGSLILLLSETLLFIILALSLGIMISTAVNNQQVAMMISMFALMLPTILLSGFIFPIESMPKALQYLSNIMPPKWYIIIVKDIMLKGSGIMDIWRETLILIVMSIFFLTVSIRKFNIRLGS